MYYLYNMKITQKKKKPWENKKVWLDYFVSHGDFSL